MIMSKLSRHTLTLVTNAGLLLAGSVLLGSGLLLQAVYHVGRGRLDKHAQAIGMDYWAWSDIHVAAMLVMSVLVATHVTLHWRWYVTVIQRRVFAKYRLVLTLTLVFLVAAITGYASWLVRLSGGAELTRRAVVEVHDKIALVLGIYLGIHTWRNLAWFLRAVRRVTRPVN